MKTFPRTMRQRRFTGRNCLHCFLAHSSTGPMFQYPWQKAVYVDAAKIPTVLYQLPCYCRCDRNMGHTSLHSCFEGLHGAECSTCAKEGYYAYQMSLKGKTVRGDSRRRDAQGL